MNPNNTEEVLKRDSLVTKEFAYELLTKRFGIIIANLWLENANVPFPIRVGNIISGAFDWSKSPQGYNFWDSFSTVYGSMLKDIVQDGTTPNDEQVKTTEPDTTTTTTPSFEESYRLKVEADNALREKNKKLQEEALAIAKKAKAKLASRLTELAVEFSSDAE